MAITAPLVARYNALRDYASSWAWGPLTSFSRGMILSVLQQIEYGRLEIVENDGPRITCGGHTQDSNAPSVELLVHNDAFWPRLMFFADMGFAESYMLGEFSCPDMTSFFRLFILNRNKLANGQTMGSALAGSLAGFLRATNTLSTSRLNIAAHYDISNDMFAAFLSPDMTYSCPVWLPRTDPASTTETLESAQIRKLDRFIDNAHLKKGDRVLEIGTGWGSFAIQAVRKTGCTVTSLTLSKEQKVLAEDRIRDAGLEKSITVLLCDYRALPVPTNEADKFDKVISIEMLEAVGREFLVTYFECINRQLKLDGGIAVFQCITMPEARYEAYARSDDFIRRYIFPGGHLPSVSQLVAAINTGSKESLIVQNIDNIGPHYAKTLRLWRENFMANFEEIIAPALLRNHKAATVGTQINGDGVLLEGKSAGMTKAEIETFRRKWGYYFSYCEAGFSTCTLGDVIITAGREGAVELAEDVPL